MNTAESHRTPETALQARRRRGEATRRAILGAAAIEFAAKGYEGGSMRSIARALGIKIAHIQHHFKDKGTLWSAVLEGVIGDYIREFDHILETNRESDPDSVIAMLIAALVLHSARNRTFAPLLLQVRASSAEQVSAFQRKLSANARIWIGLIREAQAQGTFVRGDPVILFYHMVGAALRLFAAPPDAAVLLERAATDPTIVDEHIRTCIDLFMPKAKVAPPRASNDRPSYTDDYFGTETQQRPAPSTFYLFTHVNTVMRRSLDKELRKIGITPSQMEALIRISNERTLSSAHLAKLLDVSAQSVTMFVRALETQGFIQRSQSKHSRRVLAIDVTPHGYQALDKLRKVVSNAERRILTSLSAEERNKLRELLFRMLKHQRPKVLVEWLPLLKPNIDSRNSSHRRTLSMPNRK